MSIFELSGTHLYCEQSKVTVLLGDPNDCFFLAQFAVNFLGLPALVWKLVSHHRWRQGRCLRERYSQK